MLDVEERIFLGDFKDLSSLEHEFQENNLKDLFTNGAELLVAWYGQASYDGATFVLYRKDGKLYEVNGGHCSCSGLEGQWSPEETSWEALKMRSFNNQGEDNYNNYPDEVIFRARVRQLISENLPPEEDESPLIRLL